MTRLAIQYKNQQQVIKEITDDTPYLEFPLLTKTGVVRHGFSTRLGGVSEGDLGSLNLSFKRGDRDKAVRENFRRIGAAIGVRPKDMVFTDQTHTNHVRVVRKSDRGAGITKPLTYQNVDGLVTNTPEICLVTSYADCVPLYFVDPVKKVIGLSHSGWRGTVAKIGKETIQVMAEQFDSCPEDIRAAIGPSICMDCYEVSKDVITQIKSCFPKEREQDLFYAKENSKYHLDLWKANELILIEAGVKQDHIAVGNVCTHCNNHVFFSHRYAGEKRGNLAAFLALK